MRKLKLFLTLLFAAVLSAGQMWGDKSTLTFTAACGGSGTADNGAVWTVTSDGTESSHDATKGIHYGTSSAQVKYIQLSTGDITGTITQVKVNASTASGVSATVGVTIDGSAFGGDPQSLSTTATPYTFTGEASGDIVVLITKPSKAAKAIYCKSIEVTYTTSSVVNVTSVGLNKNVINLNEDDQETLTATVLPADATNKNVTWTSDDEDVATVVDGVVTAVGAGDAVITCKSVADNTKSATCNVHVNSPYTKSKLIFTAACGGSGTADDDAEWTVTSDGTESVYDGTSGIHYGTNSANVTYVRLATSDITGEVAKVVVNARDAQATATISVTVGGTAFTCASATATNTSADYVFTGTGSGEIVVRVDRGSSMAKAIYVKSVVVSYTPAAIEVKKPTFSVEAGPYLGAQSIEISCATSGAAIYYTLDGNDPTSGSTPYTDAIDINETTTLKAIAILGTTSSPIATAAYTIINTAHAGTAEDPYFVADAKAVIDGIGTKADAYVSGKISQVDSYDGTHKSITYWISADGKTTGQQLQVYSGKGLSGADFSSVDDVVAKATVVVKGTLKKYNDVYEFDYNNQLVSYEAPAEPIVTLSPSSLNLEAEGNGTQEITLTATNFENEVNEITCAFYNTAACDGEAISQPAWITNLTDNNSNQVSFDVEDNDGDARQVWMKVTASDGTNEAYAVLAISQAKYTVDYAELPFEFDGGRADIENTNGMTQSGLDSDYGSSPKLKFNSTGDVVIIKINANPGTLTYDIKGNSFSGSTFTVQKSEDGTNYTDIKTYTALGDKQSESIDNIGQAIRYVKFIYTEKVQNGGNVALGNITISEYVAPVVKPTITTQPEGAEYTINDPAAALTIVAEAGNGGTLHYQWYSNTTQSTEGASTIGTDAATYTPSTDALGTIYYYCVVAEDGADEETTSDIVAVVVSESTPATVTYELFSGDLVAGDYVICSGTTALKNALATNTNYIGYETVTVSEGAISNPSEDLVWHVAASGDYWTIYNVAATNYAASTGAKNKGQVLTDISGDNADKALWATSGSSSYEFVNKANTAASVNANLRYNDTYGFACYSTSTGTALTLYKKKIEGQPATPTFSPAGGTYTSTQNVEIACATEEVTIHYTLDGTAPDENSTLYEGAISVSTNTTIKAIAIKNNIPSDVASSTYTFVTIDNEGTAEDPYTVADAHNAILVGGDLSSKYVAGIISHVDSYNSTYHSITYWISDDGTTANQLKVYSGKGIDGANFNSVNDLAVNDIVVVKGTLMDYQNVHEFDKNNELVSLDKPAEPTVTLKQSGSVVTTLNFDATSVANQAINVECTHFADAISSVTAKLYEESTCETEITSGAWVTDITVSDNKDQVTFAVTDNAGDARQVWMKVMASDNTHEAFATLTISQVKSASASLPFAFDGGKADLANKSGMSQTGLGSDYSASPKLKFDGTGDYLIISINEAPGKLTYDIKNNTFADGTFTVQESADGETYTEVASHTDIVDTQNEEVDLNQATRFVKFIYTEKVSGNVGLGNITISQYVEPQYEPVRNGLTAGNYYTICMEKNITAVKNATFWNLRYKNAEPATEVYLEEATTIEAGKPYIFQAGATTLDVIYGTDSEDDPINNGALRGTFENLTVSQLAAKDGDIYLLIQNAIRPNDNNYLNAHRAYIDYSALTVETPVPAPGRRVRAIPMQSNVVTGCEEINASETPVKMMIDGQLFIIRGEKMYDTTGRLVK